MGTRGGIKRLLDTIKYSGGIVNYLIKHLRMDEAKMGTLVGEDKFGNKYYENNFFFYGRNRWVEYSDKYGYDYDGSHIPAEWFGWMHYKTDLVPHKDPTRPNHKWMLDNNENLTGTPDQYVPYSTTKPKVEAWNPKSKK